MHSCCLHKTQFFLIVSDNRVIYEQPSKILNICFMARIRNLMIHRPFIKYFNSLLLIILWYSILIYFHVGWFLLPNYNLLFEEEYYLIVHIICKEEMGLNMLFVYSNNLRNRHFICEHTWYYVRWPFIQLTRWAHKSHRNELTEKLLLIFTQKIA